MDGCLSGVRIVDLTTVVLGPWATQILGDMGADVIKIETPGGDMTRQTGPRRNPGMASLFLSTNRNKRSVVLDLTTEEGKDALFRIVGTADVLVHNFRPRVMKKLGVEYERMSKEFPNLIYCAAYGFRREGPNANNPAYDDIIQAACGIADLLSVTSDQPRFVPSIVADKTSSFNVVNGILAALFAREKGAGGQEIEVPMFESLVDFTMVEHLFGANFEPPIDKMGYQRILNTMRKPYATTDGYLAVLPYTNQNWSDFFEVADRQDLKDNPMFADQSSRVKYSQEIYGMLEEIVATRSTDEWESALSAANIPVQRVLTKEDLLHDKQLEASGFWHLMDHPTEGKIRLADPPVRFSATPSAIRRLPPQLGEHNAEVLKEAGYTDEEIAALPFGR